MGCTGATTAAFGTSPVSTTAVGVSRTTFRTACAGSVIPADMPTGTVAFAIIALAVVATLADTAVIMAAQRFIPRIAAVELHARHAAAVVAVAAVAVAAV